MKRDQYPVYRAHDKAECFNCWGDLDGSYWSETHQAHGWGAFLQSCEKCGFLTCYDLEPEKEEDE
jgi:hypothetical protein